MQPGLKTNKRKRTHLSAFKGLCLRRVTPEGYFRDAENISSSEYPTITLRKPRSIINECADVYAMYAHGKICWLWGSTLFYGEEAVGELTPGEKMFASLGADIVIYPDKKLLNTHTLALTSLENETHASSARVFSCSQDGTKTPGAGFSKIEAAGVGLGFKEGDGVTVAGLSGALGDGNYMVQAAGENYLIVVHAQDPDEEITGEISIQRKAPDFDFICALDNRIWGASTTDHKICACKLGDPTNWEVFQGISTDAYQAIVPSPAPFTACSSDLGSVVFFKEEEIIRVFGNKPSNFQVTSYKMPGVEANSSKSIAYLESAVLYKGLTGVYVYDGGIPENISAFLGDNRYSNARAGAVNGKYYVSMLDETAGVYRLFVYDMRSGAWYRESAPEIKHFARSGNELYMFGADGKAYAVNASGLWYNKNRIPSTQISLKEQRIQWYFETAPMALCTPQRQYVTALHVRYSLKKDASFKIEMKCREDADYRAVGEFSGETGERGVTIDVPVRRSDSISLRFSGTDEATIFSIGKTFMEGSDR
ncbi:MAG: hypothetical protein IKJ65_05635 [Clostridia bacterium]|nr:hypothetical protein [Clostridia bacterium]